MKNIDETSAKAVLNATVHYIEQMASQRGISQYPTGFLEIDHCLRGHRDGEITVLAARPGMGKSALMMNMVMNTLMETESPRPLVIATGLTSATQFMLSVMACYSAISRDVLGRGDLQKNHWDALGTCMSQLGKLPFYIDDTIRTVSQLANLIDRVKEDHGIAPIVAIDDIAWLHLRDADFFARQSREIVSRLRDLAKSRQIPILFTANVGGDVEQRESKRPTLRDIEYIQQYEPLVDKILLLYRDDIYNENSMQKGMVEISVVKNSMGNTDTMILGFKPEFARFNSQFYANEASVVP